MPNLLIVDDEISMLKGIEYNLQDLPGYHVFTASDMDSAIEKIENEELDLVISDLMLPKLEDGLEVMREAKSQNYSPYVLAMTAFDTAENAIKAMGAGADDFISKGFSTDELVVRINNLLGKRRYFEKIAFENKILKESLKQQYNDFKIVGQSESTQNLIKKIRKIAVNLPYLWRNRNRKRFGRQNSSFIKQTQSFTICAHKLCCNPG